jgi:hypothetical protein
MRDGGLAGPSIDKLRRRDRQRRSGYMRDTAPAERNRKVRYILILESKTTGLFRQRGLPGIMPETE